jgi:hypothetical protein
VSTREKLYAAAFGVGFILAAPLFVTLVYWVIL